MDVFGFRHTGPTKNPPSVKYKPTVARFRLNYDGSCPRRKHVQSTIAKDALCSRLSLLPPPTPPRPPNRLLELLGHAPWAGSCSGQNLWAIVQTVQKPATGNQTNGLDREEGKTGEEILPCKSAQPIPLPFGRQTVSAS